VAQVRDKTAMMLMFETHTPAQGHILRKQSLDILHSNILGIDNWEEGKPIFVTSKLRMKNGNPFLRLGWFVTEFNHFRPW